ncbi:ATP-binding cassette domain-containing protein [Clostridium akagii]|uniref:ABC transporter ATP-binding protein n=1 Tax=Clostridium akagii TaxID=91623 RepID=UPI000479896F|nr:ATP-binding cassette domain-containing protein [Clostridium akagii]
MIEVMNLSKQFKDVKAVDNLNFTINDGEIVGLLGENGAGKTTTLRIISTMIKCTGGTVKVNGVDINKESSKVRSQIGILFGGEVGLYDRLTARENIRYFAELNGMTKDAADESIKNLSEELQMTEYMDRRIGKFSRGMKQKVAIARSIVHEPKVILLDEPTAGLDVSSSRLIHDFIKNCKKQNKAIVFSSHSMEEVQKLCDRIIIIHKGKMVEQGTINELKAKYNSDDMEQIFMNLVGDKNE